MESWVLTCETIARHDYRLTCEASDERRWTVRAHDIFECLMRLRLQVEGAGWLLCCNGARRDAFCSGTLRDVGGGELVYLLEGVLPRSAPAYAGQRPPVAETLDPVAPILAATVEQLWRWYGEWEEQANHPPPISNEKLYSDWLQRVAESDA